jgi:hypothetical protein
VNKIGALKPGAVALLVGTGQNGVRQPVLAWQRYGRGKAIALPVQDTWMWQMHADVPLEDMTHETFWRQLLRWLVSDVPDRVVASASADRAAPGEPLTIRAEVSDALYERVNGARVTAEVSGPGGGAPVEVPLAWSVERDGEYRATWAPAGPGVHELRVTARVGADTLAAPPTYAEAAEPDEEWFDAELHRPLLERMAAETGGRFYTPETVAGLAKDVVYTTSGATVVEQKELWDMPAVFLLLVGLVAAEWGYRRARGLA